MKLLKCFAFVLLLSTAFVACKKDNDGISSTPPNPSASPFTGKWIGKFGFNDETPNAFFSLNIKSNGEIQELNSSGVAKGKGTYTIEGSVLKGTYKMVFSPFNEYSVIATVNAAGKMEGSWGYDKNGTDGGKILLSK